MDSPNESDISQLERSAPSTRQDSGHVPLQIKGVLQEQPHDSTETTARTAEKDQTTLQSIASALGQAAQRFERCARAAERHARAREVTTTQCTAISKHPQLQ